ncbi:MAG: amino acid racemase [Lachnospiraceae bacterium]|nr:amino acid racemase [Lachnospiraceae bacterium]
MDKKKLGIIGGMGPLATAYFYEKIIERTEASCDQDHIVTYIISDPEIPKRVEYILGESELSPGPHMSDIAVKLQDMGADIIVMPCVTAHFFYKEISEKLTVRMLNILDETTAVLKDRGIKSAGILATRATVKSGILQNALEEGGIASVTPDEAEAEEISRIIFSEIKTGKRADLDSLYRIMDNMRERGAETCLIACTDLSAALGGSREGKFTDLLDILADAAVRECLSNN